MEENGIDSIDFTSIQLTWVIKTRIAPVIGDSSLISRTRFLALLNFVLILLAYKLTFLL